MKKEQEYKKKNKKNFFLKSKKNASDILGFESRLKQKEDTKNGNERGLSFTRGLYYYLQQSYLIYKCRTWSF